MLSLFSPPGIKEPVGTTVVNVWVVEWPLVTYVVVSTTVVQPDIELVLVGDRTGLVVVIGSSVCEMLAMESELVSDEGQLVSGTEEESEPMIDVGADMGVDDGPDTGGVIVTDSDVKEMGRDDGRVNVGREAEMEREMETEVGMEMETDVREDIGKEVGRLMETEVGSVVWMEVGMEVGTETEVEVGSDVGMEVGIVVGAELEGAVEFEAEEETGFEVGAAVSVLDGSEVDTEVGFAVVSEVEASVLVVALVVLVTS